MQYLILGMVALVILIWSLKKIAGANPANLARYTRNIGGVASISIAGLLAMRGALQFAAPLALFGFGLLNGGFSLGRSKKTEGQISKVNTEFLELELDHDTGAMRGHVLKGQFKGRLLNELDLEQLLVVRGDCQSDPKSAQLMDAYLDRTEPDWREQAGVGSGGADEGGVGEDASSGHTGGHAGRQAGGTGEMTIEEAYEVLGLDRSASIDDIHRAHRTLMKKNHPDQGGSTYLAAKINEAKDVLLG